MMDLESYTDVSTAETDATSGDASTSRYEYNEKKQNKWKRFKPLEECFLSRKNPNKLSLNKSALSC